MIIEKKLAGNFSGLIFLSTVFITYSIATGSIQTKSFPLPIDIDGNHYVKSTMYLRYSYEDYNEPFEEFKTKVNSPVANQFKKILQDIRDQNVPKDMVLSSRTKIAPGYQASDIFNQTVSFFNKYFPPEVIGQNFDKMKITKQIFDGNSRIIRWEVSNLSGSRRPYKGSWKFKNKLQDQNSFVLEVGMTDEIQCLMDEPFGPLEEGVKNSDFAPIDNVKCDYEYAIPSTTGSYPVYLQFNGKIYDFNVIDGVPEPNNEALVFYQQAYHLFLHSPADLTNLYTEKSAQRYRYWLEKYPNLVEWHQKDFSKRGRKVVFLLNADPFFVVFYQPFTSAKKDFSDVRCEFIVRDTDKNQLRLTNYNYIGSLYQFLDNKSLFIEPFLKPLLGKSEIPK